MQRQQRQGQQQVVWWCRCQCVAQDGTATNYVRAAAGSLSLVLSHSHARPCYVCPVCTYMLLLQVCNNSWLIRMAHTHTKGCSWLFVSPMRKANSAVCSCSTLIITAGTAASQQHHTPSTPTPKPPTEHTQQQPAAPHNSSSSRRRSYQTAAAAATTASSHHTTDRQIAV